MLIAWSDHEGRGIFAFVTIPLNKANALFWCYLMHLMCEFAGILRF
jgi:hypothetical protein